MQTDPPLNSRPHAHGRKMLNMPESFAATLVAFCRFLRANGISAGPKQTVAALEAAKAVSIANGSNLKMALRAVLCSTKAEWDVFDELFAAFWNGAGARLGIPSNGSQLNKKRDLDLSDSKTVFSFGDETPHEAAEDGAKSIFGSGRHERLVKLEFSEVPPADMAELERISHRLLRRMAFRLSRRFKRKTIARGPVDIRRTIRAGISRGGDPVDLRRRARRQEQNRLVLVLDVSGSMNAYSLFLLQFAFALQKHFRRVHTFLFSTRLMDVTTALRSRSLHQSLAALSREAIGWSGGTKIGESLRELQLTHGKLLSRNALFIVLSDGWDTGEPQALAAELDAIHTRVKKIIWLNPLLGMEGYQPITRGMNAALPHIDLFASAHNLESLLQLERHLVHYSS